MDLLDLFVKIGVKDEASEGIAQVSDGAIGKLVGAAKGAAKALAGMWAVKKVVDFGKAAFDAYSSFEQLEGGVAKLYGNANQSLDDYLKSMKDSGKSVDELTQTYQRNEQAQELMMQQATEAWRTAGVDANTYMEQATSMSAALISSLGGDTVKAAEQTDVAMRAISDNVNTFGTDAESVSMAFQGFAKQNYTMLDNLKLGYGGTKTEMERLIKDANEWGAANGKASDLSIDSFSDVVTAIEQIQKAQGIAGTTTKEAMTTIEGSMNATKAAWQNLVTEFGKPDANVSARVGDLFDAVFGVVDEKSKQREGGLFKNVTSEVGVIAQNMIRAAGDGLSTAIDWIASNAPRLVTNAMKSIGDAIGNAASGLGSFTENFNLVDAIFGEGGAGETASKALEWIQGLGQTFSDNWPYIQEQLSNLWNQVVETAQTFGPQIMEVAGRLVGMARDAIVEHGPEILAKVGEVIGKVIAHIGTFVADMVSKGREFIGGLITGSSEEGQKLHKWFADFFPDGLLKGLGDFATFLLDAGRALIDGLLNGIGEVAPDVEDAIRTAFDAVISFFETMGEFIQDPIGTIQRGFDALMGSSEDAASGVEKSMGKVEGSVDKSMTNASASVQKYNGTKLKDKSATAKVTGNAENGSAKKAVNDTNTAVQKLKDKSVSVDVKGNVTSGVAGGTIRTALDLIGRMKDKSVTLTTNNVTRNTKITETKQARGGIRKHARGDIFVANNPGAGVDLDIVKDITGEAGPEAIVPLTSHYGKDFAQMMGKEAAKVMGGSGTTVNIYMTYNAGEDATQMVSDIAAGLQLVL